MNNHMARVGSATSLCKAISGNATVIEVEGVIDDLPSISLPRGMHLVGVDDGAELRFRKGQPGLMLTADHRIAGLRIVADDTQIALGLADSEDDLGTLDIRGIRTVGRFHLEANQAMRGHIVLDGIWVERADARMVAHRPAGFGVEVVLGALTVLNASRNHASHWTIEARNLSGGSSNLPLRGSGVLIFGGDYIPVDADMAQAPAPLARGGGIDLSILTTGEIHADGGIPAGIGNLISGGVFVGSGVHAHNVVNQGPVATYGPNDMVLDNWGKVDSWRAQAPVISQGASGIGFVNFGDIDVLEVTAPIETHGLGARGFNLYDGTLREARFDSITTYGDGAIGIQLARPFGKVLVHGDVRTKGGEGESLVRGKVMQLKAHALSLKPGAKGEALVVSGVAVAEDTGISDLDFQTPASMIAHLEVAGRQIV